MESFPSKKGLPSEIDCYVFREKMQEVRKVGGTGSPYCSQEDRKFLTIFYILLLSCWWKAETRDSKGVCQSMLQNISMAEDKFPYQLLHSLTLEYFSGFCFSCSWKQLTCPYEHKVFQTLRLWFQLGRHLQSSCENLCFIKSKDTSIFCALLLWFKTHLI